MMGQLSCKSVVHTSLSGRITHEEKEFQHGGMLLKPMFPKMQFNHIFSKQNVKLLSVA